MPFGVYLDEHLSPELAARLKRRGVDVLTTVEAGQLAASDPEQLEFATANRRVIVTFDRKDFIPLAQRWSHAGRDHGGILVAVPGRSANELEAAIMRLWHEREAKDMVNAVLWLSN